MEKLSSPVRDYAWGSVTALPHLLGQVATDAPQAELWIGAHPGSPSVVVSTGQSLDQAIAQDATAALGASVSGEYGRLPYLMKVLAAAQPLSLQVHPTPAQAAEGFAREQAEGPSLDSPERNYKDDQHKPEMIVALTPFDALSGFRDPVVSALAFRWLQDEVDDPEAATAAGHIAATLERGTAEEAGNSLRSAAIALLQGDEDVRRLARLAPDYVQARIMRSAEDATVEHPGLTDPSLPLLVRLGEAHPGDAGVLLALMLNLVRLAPGEAMSLAAGNIHAYLEGVGVEIMANSDNVLRGGLTSKHVDVPELLKIVDFSAVTPRRVMPFSPVPGLELYLSGFAEFDLARLTHAEEPVRLPGDGPAEIVVLSGSLDLTAAHGERLHLERGDTAFIPSADEPVTATGSVDVDAYVAVADLGTYVDSTGI